MKESMWPIICLAFSLALAGFTVVFADSLPYALLLIIAAGILVIVVSGWTLWEWIPRILTDVNRPIDTARKIYRRAAVHGGTIHATHVFPKNSNPDQDIAIDELRKAHTEVDIVFHRILVLDSIEDERLWLEQLFQLLPNGVVKHFLLLKSYPLIIPRFTKILLPRVNLLLYQSHRGSRCQSFIGLDRLRIRGLDVNVGVYSRSKRVHRALLRYFEHISGADYFRSCSSIEEYTATQSASSQLERGQTVVSRIVEYAETTQGILYVGLFGSMARAALGFASHVNSGEAEMDVDLLLIHDRNMTNEKKTEVRRDIENVLDAAHTHVTWGPDLDRFYEFREDTMVEVDIEYFVAGTNFYSDNRLLGYSIFRYFMPLYSVDQQPATAYLVIPTEAVAPRERWELVLNDRQGIRAFQKFTQPFPMSTDPRRLCTHILRNVCWAETGMSMATGKIIGEYFLNNEQWTNKNILRDAVAMLVLSTAEIQRNLALYQNTAKAFIEDVAEFAEQKALNS